MLTGELAEFLVFSSRDGLAASGQGLWDDGCMINRWEFDVADITIPVLVMHGKHDKFVPLVTANGWPRIFRGSSRGCSTMTGT